jgi:hypothetical protein
MRASTSTVQPQRLGVAWVLRQAAVIGVLALTAVQVVGVVCLAGGERRLARAIKASAAEALLPAASSQSVRHRAFRMLHCEGFETHTVSLAVQRDGQTECKATHLRPGDAVRVRICVAGRSSLPTSIARLAPWRADETLVSEATVIIPSP